MALWMCELPTMQPSSSRTWTQYLNNSVKVRIMWKLLSSLKATPILAALMTDSHELKL